MDYRHHTETLPNGLRLLWLDLPHLHSACLTAFVPAGVLYETPDNNGVSHLLEHLHLSVTRRHPTRRELRQAIDALAGHFRAYTEGDKVCFRFEGPPDAIPAFADLMADILEVRPYPERIIESEKRLVLNELKGRKAGAHRRFRRALFRRHPCAMPRAGTRRSVMRLTAGDVWSFDRASFAPEGIVVAAAGSGIERQLDRMLRPLSALPRGETTLPVPALPSLSLPLYSRRTSRRVLRTVTIGFANSGDISPRRRLALRVLRRAMRASSSPLFEQIRYQSSSVYQFVVNTERIHETELFYASGSANRSERDAFSRSLVDELTQMRSCESIPEWLDIARRQYGHLVRQAMDSPAAVASRIVGGERRIGNDYLAVTIPEELDMLKALTSRELHQVAHDMFRRENMFVIFDGLNRPFDERRLRRLIDSRFA